MPISALNFTFYREQSTRVLNRGSEDECCTRCGRGSEYLQIKVNGNGLLYFDMVGGSTCRHVVNSIYYYF
jgi:hypothetical protein